MTWVCLVILNIDLIVIKFNVAVDLFYIQSNGERKFNGCKIGAHARSQNNKSVKMAALIQVGPK